MAFIFRYLKRRYLSKYQGYLESHGLSLIVVAAVTPVAYAGTAMLMGSTNFPFRKFWIYALTRFILGIYAFAF